MIWLPVVGKYADVDVYASILAYENLLNQRGKSAQNYIPIAPNYSVPDALRLPDLEHKTFDFDPTTDEAIILDISQPEQIHTFVQDDQILEIIDHHPGYEQYWQDRIGKKSIIEPIGAVATSIFEWWGECWNYAKMPTDIAKLLLAAILDNTLNFNANITTDRDHQAAAKLATMLKTSVENFAKWYFTLVSQTIAQNLANSILQDQKTIQIPGTDFDTVFAQLTLWSAKGITDQTAQIQQIMEPVSPNWLISIISISEGKNYLLTSSDKISKYLTQLLDLSTKDGWLISKQLYLRKEIIAKMLHQ